MYLGLGAGLHLTPETWSTVFQDYFSELIAPSLRNAVLLKVDTGHLLYARGIYEPCHVGPFSGVLVS